MSKRILFSSTRGAGHVHPLLPYARALKQRGHDVFVAAPESVRPTIEASGLAHAPFNHVGDEALAPIWARFRQVPPEEALRIAMSEIFAGLNASTALPKLLDLMRSFKPDLVVRDSVEFGSLIAAESLAVPHARIAVHLCSFEEAIPRQTAASLDTLRGQVGLAPDQSESVRSEPVFSAFPASMEDPSVTLARAPFRAQMPLMATATSTPSFEPSRDGLPLIYITFGTIAAGTPETRIVYRAAVEAMADLPVRALLTTGPAMEAGALGSVPSNVRVEAWVPQHEVLPHAAVVMCHGGSGTVLGTLAAAVPLVLAPLFADQPYNAEQLARVGAGVAVAVKDAATLRAAVIRVLEEAAFRNAARRLADEMAQLPTLDAAVDAMLALQKG